MIARIAAALAFLFVCTSAVAQERLGTANVTARLTPDGVRAEVRLSRAVTSFTFDEADVVRDGDFTVLTENLTLSGDTITSDQPFRRFEVLVRPMTQERDAKYPAFFRLGAGGVLYAPALYADQRSWRTRLRIQTARGEAMAPTAGPEDGGSVFIGPRAYITRIDQALVVAPPDAPRGLFEAAFNELRASMEFYTNALGITLPTQPVLVMTGGGEGQGYVGDVTPGPFVSLRFYGAGWADPAPETRARLSRFVSHEAFHFWNGALLSSAEGTPSWLHEGGADYAALLSANNAGALDDAGVRDALGEALTRCRDALKAQGDVGINTLEFLSQQVRYPCGIVIQWAADLSVRRASGGELDVLDLWGEILNAGMARTPRAFTLADFTGAQGNEGAATAISLLTEQSGEARWVSLPEALRGLGAGISEAPTNTTRRTAALFHLLRQNCPGAQSIGFYTESTGLRLDNVPECGALANAVLNSLEGGDPTNVSAETFERVREACAQGSGVEAVVNNEPVRLACERTLPDPANAYIVTRWR